jgi:hypothetical protein
MTSQRQTDTLAREPSLGAMPTAAHELAALTTAVRVAVGKRANWRGYGAAGGLRARAAPSLAEHPHRLAAHRGSGDISIQIYGTDVARIGSSVRRHYDLPVQPSRLAA